MNLVQDRPNRLDEKQDFKTQVPRINDTFAAAWRRLEDISKNLNIVNTNLSNITNVTNLIGGVVPIGALTPTRLVATDGGGALTSVLFLSAWIGGTANQVIVTDTGAGGVVLSTPQDIAITSNPTFAGLTLTGQLLAADGAVGAPSYSFFNSPTTGFYRIAAETIGLIGVSIAGALVFSISANSFNVLASSYITMADDTWIGLGAAAARIEFDNQATDEINLLDCFVGIGINAPLYHLHLVSADGISDNTYVAYIDNQEATASRNNGLWLKAGSNANDYNIRASNIAGTELWCVTGGGYIGIGATAPASLLEVYSSTASPVLTITGAQDRKSTRLNSSHT